MILFESIRLQPEPSDALKVEALAEADSVLGLLSNGGDFEELAERFSDGPSASEGGGLGWIRRTEVLWRSSKIWPSGSVRDR